MAQPANRVAGGPGAAVAVVDPAFRPDSAGLVPHGLTDRARRNLAALDRLVAVESAGAVTAADREVLVRWTGWGALSALFDASSERYGTERAELRARLSPVEWRAASASTLNAHYTAPEVIAAVWRLVDASGFTGGRVLEPGCGTGLFIGLAPSALRASSRFVGVEVEPVTARIAQALYPAPEIRPVGFETVTDPDGSFDVAVGNVPFGKLWLFDPAHNRDRHSIHNHFILKSLRLVKPGGLVAVVTSRFTLDARNPSARRAFAEVADLVAAIRLPNGTHEALAGTRVVTDLVVFRRHDGTPTRPFDWERTTEIDVDGVPLRVNAWFAGGGAGVVAGTLTAGRGVYGDDELLVDPPPSGLSGAVTAAAAAVTARVAGCFDPSPPNPSPPQPVTAPVDGPAFGELVAVGVAGLAEHRPGGPVRVTGLTTSASARLRALVELRDLARQVLAVQRGPTDAGTVAGWDGVRRRLNAVYDAYSARWGPINAFDVTSSGGRRLRAPARFRKDPGWGLVAALEVFNPDTQTAQKAAIFSRWLTTPERRFTGADTAVEALAASLAAGRGVDAGFIADQLAGDPAAVIAELAAAGLVFRHHDDLDRWEPAVAYLSGDVRSRLRAARTLTANDDRYTANVAALEAVLPEWLPAEAISARPGAVWIPASDVAQFLVDTLGGDARTVSVEHAAVVGRWSVTVGGHLGLSPAARLTWGTSECSAYALVEDALNLTPTVVYQTLADGTRVKLEDATLAANDKKAELIDRFAEWVWEDPERAARLEAVYNERFNSTVLPVWDGTHLTDLPGVTADFHPHRHQLDAVWRIMGSTGNVLLGHRVGAGKTAAMVIAGQQLRRTGQITKPLYVVPNHMLDQFAAELAQLYPLASVLVASKDDLSEQARRAFVARCATGDWDAVVMTQSTFGRIPVHPDTERAHVEAELHRFLTAADAAREAGQPRAVKEIERAAARWRSRLQDLHDTAVDRGNVTFEELGVDYVFIDEAHAYKGLPFVSSLPLSRSQSKRATDMVMKLDWLRSRYGPKVVTFATGTPVANSLAEMWVLQRFLDPDALRDTGMEAFDSWAGTFARPVTRLELAPEGGRFRLHTRIAAFDNVPELLVQFRAFADLLDPGATPALAVPDLVGGSPETVVVEPTVELGELIAGFAERADRIRSRAVDPREDNMLVVCNDGRLASLDLRLVGGDQPAGTGKVDAVAVRVHAVWVAHRDRCYLDAAGQPSSAPGALQVVFCDKGTPSGDRFSVYDELRRLLAARGMDPDRIRFIHDAGTDAAKARLFAACRDGGVDVLVGSTEKMGTGVNVQRRLVALHHVDVPWRPADIEQREGRILRQGNQNAQVHVVRYVTTGSFDPYMWGTVERKARFITQITSPLDAADQVRSVEDLDAEVVLSYAEIKAVATGNPLIRDHAEVAAEVARLNRLAANHARTQRSLPGRLDGMRRHLDELDATITRLDDLDRRRADTRGDRFVFTAATGQRFTERAAAGDWVRRYLGGLRVDGQWQPVGELGGLTWHATRSQTYQAGWATPTVAVAITGDSDTVTWVGSSMWDHEPHVLMTRLERHLDRLAERRSRITETRVGVAEQLSRGQAGVGQPFSHASRLSDLTARLEVLDSLLVAIGTPDDPVGPSPVAADTGLQLT